jgi:serine/threonine-protein kinase
VIGEPFGNYTVVGKLGRSGVGDLWRGENTADKHPVTIEVLPVAATSFAAVGVAHHGLPRVLDCGVSAGGRPYLVLGAFEGQSLADRLRDSGPLSGAQVAYVAYQIANALDALHSAGVVHRCLTTAGIYVVANHVLVLDAGLVAHRGAYTAPERWEGAGLPDPRADLYALGCLAYELACGQAPFLGTANVLREHHERTAPALDKLGKDFPPTLGKLIGRMLDKDPAHRPPAARELARVLSLLVGGEAAPPLAVTGADKPQTLVPNLGPTLVTSGPTLSTTLDHAPVIVDEPVSDDP